MCDAFGLDLSDSTQKTTYGAGPGLKNVWDVFMKTQAKIGAGAGAQRPAAGPETGGASKSAKVSPQQTLLRNALSVCNSHRLLSCPSLYQEPSADDKAKAESLKGDGNKAMSSKDYGAAIAAYTQAIELYSNNPVYFSNRSAAYAQVGQHDKAIEDAREASKVDPKFGKAYSRLG